MKHCLKKAFLTGSSVRGRVEVSVLGFQASPLFLASVLPARGNTVLQTEFGLKVEIEALPWLPVYFQQGPLNRPTQRVLIAGSGAGPSSVMNCTIFLSSVLTLCKSALEILLEVMVIRQDSGFPAFPQKSHPPLAIWRADLSYAHSRQSVD